MTLKELFEKAENGALTYEQFNALCEKEGMKLADLSTGEYVSKKKHEAELGAKDETINTLQTTITNRDTDLGKLEEQLKNAGADSSKLEALSNEFNSLKTKYEEDSANYQKQLHKQAYDFAVREFAGQKKFTSNAAKRDFINSMLKQDLQLKDNKILGADDFTTAYAKENEDAFVVESQADQKLKPQMVSSTTNVGGESSHQSNDGGFNFNFTGVRPRN